MKGYEFPIGYPPILEPVAEGANDAPERIKIFEYPSGGRETVLTCNRRFDLDSSEYYFEVQWPTDMTRAALIQLIQGRTIGGYEIDGDNIETSLGDDGASYTSYTLSSRTPSDETRSISELVLENIDSLDIPIKLSDDLRIYAVVSFGINDGRATEVSIAQYSGLVDSEAIARVRQQLAPSDIASHTDISYIEAEIAKFRESLTPPEPTDGSLAYSGGDDREEAEDLWPYQGPSGKPPRLWDPNDFQAGP